MNRGLISSMTERPDNVKVKSGRCVPGFRQVTGCKIRMGWEIKARQSRKVVYKGMISLTRLEISNKCQIPGRK